MNPTLRWKFLHWLKGGNVGVMKRLTFELAKQRLIEQGFKDSDPNVISTLTDKELAAFQSKYGERSRQFILADYEWQRRLTLRQVKATNRGSLIGVVSTILGVILGYLLPVLWRR